MDLLPESATHHSGVGGSPSAHIAMAANPVAPVVALHCSGAGAGLWRRLAEVLGASRALIAPEHFGCESVGPWTGMHAFTLADEAARTIALIDRADGDIHLVGHSYGGGVALHVALARPERIASLALYEPSAFHLLRQLGAAGQAPFDEISAVVRDTSKDVLEGDFRRAAARFVDYWGGPGSWNGLRPSAQDAITRWMPKAPLDFNALIAERTPVGAYTALRVPTLLLRGAHAPRPTRIIAEALATLIPGAELSIVAGAGHMGPLTHAAEVNSRLLRHIDTTEPLRVRARLPTANAGTPAQ